MPEEEVRTPEGSAGEAVEPTEPAAPAPTEPAPAPQADPLDDIQDPTARAEAKKHRAIARRAEKHDEELPAPTPATQPEFAKKDDVALLVTNQAKALVSEEVLAAWDDLMKIPLAGANPMDAQSIASNMSERFILYREKQKQANPARPLSESHVVHGAPPSKKPEEKKPVFRLPDADKQAEQLYGKS